MEHLRRTRFAGAFGLLVLGAGEVRAQVSAFVDLASGNATYDGLPGQTILALSPYVAMQQPRWSLAATGTYTTFDRGGWSGQGSFAGSWFTPALGPIVAELSARGDHSARAFGFATGQALGQARAHLYGPGRGVWLGASAGRAWQGRAQEAVVRTDVGVWARKADTRVTMTLARGTTWDSAFAPGSPTGPLASADAFVRRVEAGFTEATAALEWAQGPAEIASTVARRMVRGSADQMSWQVSGTYWFSSAVGVIAGAGRYAPDPWLAHPGGRYITLSLRLGVQPLVRARMRPRLVPTLTSSMAFFEATAAGPGQWLLQVRAPLAQKVEVMGDFTDWQPVTLKPAGDGSWVVLMPLSAGTYRMNLRLDGGAWAVPPGLGVAEDEFSGVVGVLIVGT